MGKYVPAIIAGAVVTVVLGFLLGMIGFQGFAAWYIPVFGGLITGYLMANLQGTKSGPAASDEQRVAALALRPSPGKALIIAHRQGFVGKMAGMQVSLDGQPIVQLKSPQFTAVEVEPGAHTIEFGFVGLAAAQNKPERVNVTLVDGEVVAYLATVSMGTGKNTIKVIRDEPIDMVPDTLRNVRMVASA
ncbi:hypothetical protein GCM10009422_23540 [Brevundimonas kwangchunensis]|uniref:DUF2846 domain-containing protein n=1 Tax=Brevundimonas kwangchunensis TaxID=322163 RepID=A0ABN1H175_9CAUL